MLPVETPILAGDGTKLYTDEKNAAVLKRAANSAAVPLRDISRPI
jgi:hypothetical protein